ncbi:MAG: hypothetical protein HUJ86_03500, partial [Synergistes sp.]|nr:hypothetical protein [Synergistes sp.]
MADNHENSIKYRVKEIAGTIGIPTLIIAAFWALTLLGGFIVGISMSTLLSDTIKRAGMNG